MDLVTAVDLAREGKNEGYEYLYNLVKDKSFYVAKKYMKNNDASEELLQECFVELMSKNKLDSLSDNNSFVSWFNQIVANKAKDYFKKSENKNSFFSSYENEDGSNYIDTFEEVDVNALPEEAAIRKIEPEYRKKIVDELMADLSDEQRYCIVAHYLQDLSVKDIANILNVSENTVKSRLFQGRKKIENTGNEMKKRGIELFGILPFALFLGLSKEEAMACEYTGTAFTSISSAGNASTGSVATGTKEAVKASASIAGKAVGTKVIVGAIVGVVSLVAAGVGVGAAINGMGNKDKLAIERYYIDFYGNGTYIALESGSAKRLDPKTKEKKDAYFVQYSAATVKSGEELIERTKVMQDYAENDVQHIYAKLINDKYYLTPGPDNTGTFWIRVVNNDNTIDCEGTDSDVYEYVENNNYDFSSWVDITEFEDKPMTQKDAWDYSMEHQEEWIGLINSTKDTMPESDTADEPNDNHADESILEEDSSPFTGSWTNDYPGARIDVMFDIDFDKNTYSTGDIFGTIEYIGDNKYEATTTGYTDGTTVNTYDGTIVVSDNEDGTLTVQYDSITYIMKKYGTFSRELEDYIIKPTIGTYKTGAPGIPNSSNDSITITFTSETTGEITENGKHGTFALKSKIDELYSISFDDGESFEAYIIALDEQVIIFKYTDYQRYGIESTAIESNHMAHLVKE